MMIVVNTGNDYVVPNPTHTHTELPAPLLLLLTHSNYALGGTNTVTIYPILPVTKVLLRLLLVYYLCCCFCSASTTARLPGIDKNERTLQIYYRQG